MQLNRKRCSVCFLMCFNLKASASFLPANIDSYWNQMSPYTFTMNRGALICAVCILCLVRSSYPKPALSWESPYRSTHEDHCKIQEDIEELCQRCAKKTKSNIVYPMCCESLEEAREWCTRFINYGLQERHFISPD